jgi:hypothetical protein
MNTDPKKIVLPMLAVLGILFCTIAGVLFVRHSQLEAKKGNWTVSIRPSGAAREKAVEPSRELYAVNDEELAQMRKRLERKAWEVAQARENEAAMQEGREPVQIVAGSDLPAILKYYENQNAVNTAAGDLTDPPAAQPSEACVSGIDTASVESLRKTLGGSAWTFSSSAAGSSRLEFYEDGGYITAAGIGQWTVSSGREIVMDNSHDDQRYTVTVSADGKRFDGQRSDGLAVSAVLICGNPA